MLTLEPVHGKMERSFRKMTGRMLRARGGNLYERTGLGEDAAVAADPLQLLYNLRHRHFCQRVQLYYGQPEDAGGGKEFAAASRGEHLLPVPSGL